MQQVTVYNESTTWLQDGAVTVLGKSDADVSLESDVIGALESAQRWFRQSTKKLQVGFV
jgi:hypothetical protein